MTTKPLNHAAELPHQSEAPPGGVLERVLQRQLARCTDGRIHCDVDIAPHLPTFGSEGAWMQVLGQLVANSVLHGFAGRPRGRIRLSAHLAEDGTTVRVVYSDDGAGLSPLAREHAFRRRFTSRAAQGSSGLGLCLLRDTVQARLNGAIALLDTPVGAAFAIDVPASVKA